MDIKCLIDTNILIQLEEAGDDGWLKKNFADFANLYHKHGIRVFIHPASIQDIEQDRNESRKKKTLQAVQKYPQLEHAPVADRATLETLFAGINKSNDLVDAQLLYTLKQNAVHYLISEDDGVHKRARYAGINERVFSVREFSTLVRRLFEPHAVSVPHVEDVPVYSIDKSTAIFTSLRGDYTGFDVWIEKCCVEGRKAWTVKVGNQTAGVCIYKDEGDKCEFEGLGRKVLKLCTFKVAEDFRGSKLGELLLKTAFLYCVENNYTSTYLTAFTRHEYLMEFLKDFGFQVHQKQTKDGQFVFYKVFERPGVREPRVEPLDFHIKYAPHFYDDDSVKKYVIPIQPQYHELLFPEITSQKQLPLIAATTTVPGNTIKKVYLSNSKIKELERGGLILFYRSEDSREVTTIGLVERTSRSNDVSEVVRLVGKRSVYSYKEIENMAKKSVLVTEFRFVRHLSKPLRFSELKKAGVLNGPPQSILELPHVRFASVADEIRSS